MYKYKIYNNPSQKKNRLVDQILTLIDDISESKTATKWFALAAVLTYFTSLYHSIASVIYEDSVPMIAIIWIYEKYVLNGGAKGPGHW